ncbi:MAG: hypothetical protein I3273_07875 [Candidatus Moeniiplasma glomeromycotorum]|nr:hypothetical protein [Candidatus Moeniiplasma glomeromycotorum]MCE8168480.1 hypothetical protein [Candidatus Moeniiplasma glomeromycotorum]MCE8169997.1 hypothetical protein [Candidatus Moeniiplasma glomeromycotorum]
MEWKSKENNKQKHLFKSYYCSDCKQTKPCQLFAKQECCNCVYQIEREKFQEYISYEKILTNKQRERQETLQELKQLRIWKEQKKCSYCGKKTIQKDWLLRGELVCLKCSKGHSEMCWSSQQKWYQKWWKINLEEWLEKYPRLPVNKNCAELWVKDKEHLKSCQCLEREAKKLSELFTGSLQRSQELLKKCVCEKSEKLRVGNDYFSECERCGESIEVASKKRVIRNRNDVRFWGIESKWKVLCLGCIGRRFYKRMVDWQRKKFREYLRRGYK